MEPAPAISTCMRANLNDSVRTQNIVRREKEDLPLSCQKGGKRDSPSHPSFIFHNPFPSLEKIAFSCSEF